MARNGRSAVQGLLRFNQAPWPQLEAESQAEVLAHQRKASSAARKANRKKKQPLSGGQEDKRCEYEHGGAACYTTISRRSGDGMATPHDAVLLIVEGAPAHCDLLAHDD
jgi:hypothetical protein